MITFEDALHTAEKHVERLSRECGATLMLKAQETRTTDFGWVFFYDSKAYMDTGDPTEIVAGNAPIIIDRLDGSLHVTGTARELDFYLNNYRTLGKTV